MMKSFALAILIGSMAVGCTREASPRSVQESARPELSDANPTATAAPSSTQLSATEISALRKNAPDFVARFKVRLDLSKLEVEVRSQSAEQRKELFAYVEQAALQIEALETGDASRKKILSIFMNAMTEGCSETLSNCRYPTLFRANPGTVTLLLAAADDAKSNLRLRYRILGLTFASVARRNEPRLAVAYLEMAEAYETELLKKDDLKSRQMLQQHREIIDQSMMQLKESYSQETKPALTLLSRLETGMDIWNFDRPRRTESLAREETVLTLVASKLFEKDSDHAALAKQIALTKADSRSAFPKLAKVALPARKALGIREALPENTVTFLFDNIWMSRLSQNEADIIWKAYLTSLNLADGSFTVRRDAQAQLLNYGRTRLLLSAKDANSILTDFFNTKGKFATADAFREGLKESIKARTMWADSIRRFEALRQFNDRNLRSSNEDDPAVKDLDMFFASIDRNINLLSTYPSMLVMSYHLARLGFSLKLQTWTGTLEIRAGQILDWFFDGVLDPWMAYGNDTRALSKSEISMVFYYALEMGTLTDGGVNLEHLFKMLTEQMVGPLRADVEKIDDGFRTSFETDPTSGEFYRLCTQIEAMPAGPTVTPVPVINLEALQNFSMAGLPQAFGAGKFMHPTFAAGWNLFETERKVTKMKLDENLEVLRLELTPKITRLRTLARVTDDFAIRHERPDHDALMTAIELKIQPLEALRKRVYTRIFKLIKQTSACGEKLVQTELKAQEHVIQGLASHFRDVHKAMKALRAKSNVKNNESSPIHREFGFANKVSLPGLAEHEQALGFNNDSYRLSRLQVLLRIAEVLEQGFNDRGTKVLPRREKGAITLPARLRDIDESWRSMNLRLDWNSDVDEFVTDGIQQVFDPKTGFIRWSNLNLLGASAQLRIRSMSALAKAGTVETDSGPQRIETKEVIRETLVMERWLEVDASSMWTSVLNMTGQFTRVDLAVMLDDFAWEKSSHAWLGSLDYAFEQIAKDKLGEGTGAGGDGESSRYTRRNGPLAELKKHSLIARTFGEPTLKIPATTMTQLTDLYTKSLDVQMNLVGEFIAESKKLEPAKLANPAIFPSWRMYTSRKSPEVPLLAESATEVFRSQTAEYSRQTGYKMPESVQSALDKR
ncbi:hypothetical protein BH10BDE1_BH10BDE1_24070 [soil metagenome]